MVTGIYQLVDGSLAHKLRFETIANNLANVNSNGFKKDLISFDRTNTTQQYSYTDFTPGSIVYTGNQCDIALEGEGFFKVQTAEGIRYTRNGNFMLNSSGELVTQNGDPVLGTGGTITVSGSDFKISGDGKIMGKEGEVARLELVAFEDRQQLKKDGRTYFRFDGEADQMTSVENVSVKQYYVETSNVNPTVEMIKMMEAYRGFESAQKAIQSLDEITSKMVNDTGLIG